MCSLENEGKGIHCQGVVAIHPKVRWNVRSARVLAGLSRSGEPRPRGERSSNCEEPHKGRRLQVPPAQLRCKTAVAALHIPSLAQERSSFSPPVSEKNQLDWEPRAITSGERWIRPSELHLRPCLEGLVRYRFRPWFDKLSWLVAGPARQLACTPQ